MCVCLFVVELLLHFCPDRLQIWTPDRYSKGKFNEGVLKFYCHFCLSFLNHSQQDAYIIFQEGVDNFEIEHKTC